MAQQQLVTLMNRIIDRVAAFLVLQVRHVVCWLIRILGKL